MRRYKLFLEVGGTKIVFNFNYKEGENLCFEPEDEQFLNAGRLWKICHPVSIKSLEDLKAGLLITLCVIESVRNKRSWTLGKIKEVVPC